MDRSEMSHVVMVLGWLGIASFNAGIWAVVVYFTAGLPWAVAMWLIAFAGTTLSLGLLSASADDAEKPL